MNVNLVVLDRLFVVVLLVLIWTIIIAFVLAFYALEARWVFVFPAMAHGESHPFARSWSITRKHGGTLAAMRVVMPIASWMLFGGLRDGRIVRAWVTGCHAVLLWYEELAGRGRTS